MIITKVSETPIKDTPHKVDARMIYNKETAQAVRIKLMPGEGLKPHITPVDVFFYILEGTPDILVGDETQTIKANCLVESPKDIPHCITNNSDGIVRVLVVKAPRPSAKAKLL